MATNINFPIYGFINNVLALSEENWRRFFKPFITDSVQNGLATTAGANMTVYVSAGECRCGAVMGILDEMIAIDIANGDSTYDRIDSIVVQYTYGEPSTLAITIVQGTPSANPVPPTLTKVYDTLWQMEIAQILVPSGATSSSEFTITDKRIIYESIVTIDNNTISEESVWSSQKTYEEIVSLSTEMYDSLNTKADAITRTTSGDIVTFEAETDHAIQNVTVAIEPVQDLHGYDNPWPADGGINKLAPAPSGTVTDNGCTCVSDGNGGYTLSGTASGNANLYITPSTQYTVQSGDCLHMLNSVANASVTISFTFTDNTQWAPSLAPANRIIAFTEDTIGKTISTVRFYVSNGQTYSGTVKPMILNTSAVTAFTPYSNICPISGWDTVNVTRTGVNIWGGEKMADDMVSAVNNATYCTKGTDTDGKYVTLTASANIGAVVLSTGVKFKQNTQYTVIVKGKRSSTNAPVNMAIRYSDGTSTQIKLVNDGSIVANTVYTAAVVSAAGKTVDSIRGSWQSSTTYFYYDSCGIFEGVHTVDEFTPYLGTTATIDLNGTRYGGTLDVTQGKMLVTKGYADLGTLTWNYDSNGYFETSAGAIENIKSYAINQLPDIICSMLETKFGYYVYTTGIGIGQQNTKVRAMYPNAGTDPVAFKTSLSGVQLVYTLAEPFEVQLTPAQISSLIGTNYLWADCGDILNLDYAIDTESYIQKNAIIAKAPIITESASGSIVSIVDGADDMPLESLSVDVEPVQDLHGYDSPWPAGGGKNLWPVNNGGTAADVTFTYNNGVVKLNGTASSTYNFTVFSKPLKAGTYTLSCDYSGTLPSDNEARIQIYSASVSPALSVFIRNNDEKTAYSTFTVAEDTTADFRIHVVNGFNYQNVLLYPQLESGSTITPFAPYSNICPISGWTEATVTRTGRNLLDISKIENVSHTYGSITNNGDGTLTVVHLTGSTAINTTKKLSQIAPNLKVGTVCTLKAITNGNNYAYLSNVGAWDYGKSKTITQSMLDSYVYLYATSEANTTATISNMQINVGSTVMPYEAYTSTTLPISWQSSAGTVYGGTLDVDTGTLTVTHEEIDLGTLTFTYDNQGWFQSLSAPLFGSNGKAKLIATPSDSDICEIYTYAPVVSTGVINGRFYVTNSSTLPILRITDDRYTDPTAFQTAVTGVKAVFELQKPVIITGLTPAVLNTLKGDNNILADCGTVNVSYRADTKLFIENAVAEANATTRKMIADTANGNLAPKALDSGDLIIVGDELRKCTANIGLGNAITDTNSTVATLADVIKALQ